MFFERRSFAYKLRLVEDYRSCSGMKINHEKSETAILGDPAYTLQHNNAVTGNLKLKKALKILGVLFTYDLRAKKNLNVDQLISSIQQKLRIWRWRHLTIIGRIQIVKTYIVFYEECFKRFAKCSAANHRSTDKISQNLLCGTINLFVSGVDLCILEICQKKEFLECGI